MIAMSVTTNPETEPPNDAALKKLLINRIVIAVVIVAGLLGSLVMLDTRPPAPEKVVAAPAAPAPAPVPAPVAKEPAVEQTKDDATAAPAPVAKAEETVPERSAAPSSPSLQASSVEKPLTKPATGRHAALHPAAPVSPGAARPEPARELAAPKSSPAPAGSAHRVPEHQPASRPLVQATARNLGLQLGVFSNVANAEELRAKLEQNGIPASIEARVHVGPFATRAEADQARAKLKELGIGDSLPITMRTRKTP
jgi:DedD protein